MTGHGGGSFFHVGVKAVSQAIPTKDIRLTTSWIASDGTRGGATVTGPPASMVNTNYSTYRYQSPLGFGPGVDNWRASGTYYVDQHFGNYSLVAGTRMHNVAAGWSTTTGGYGISPDTRFEYSSGTYRLGPGQDGSDAMMAILGKEWYHLRQGDVVQVKIMHIPSGKLLYDGKVSVEG